MYIQMCLNTNLVDTKILDSNEESGYAEDRCLVRDGLHDRSEFKLFIQIYTWKSARYQKATHVSALIPDTLEEVNIWFSRIWKFVGDAIRKWHRFVCSECLRI